jgi:protein involved in polysaccharide export with SLBB domain
VTNLDLARSYLRKAEDRLEVLDVLQRRAAFSDVVREAQELVDGDIDFIPTEEYTADDAAKAISDARLVVAGARLAIAPPSTT